MTSSYYLRDERVQDYLVRFSKSGFGVMAEVYCKVKKDKVIIELQSWCKQDVFRLVKLRMKERGLLK